jgi:phosphopentomutase
LDSLGRPGLVAVVVCDSVGCGGAPDAALFGDDGANTLRHVVEASGLELPNLAALGAERIVGVPALGSDPASAPTAAHGRMFSQSPAKDTMVGHWELMGVVADQAFPTYPDGFPLDVIDAFERAIGRAVLGNRPASGTTILEELGPEHLRSGFPIVYTSGDSVFQIAAHDAVIGVDTLYEYCTIARELLTGEHGVGRVIARPFTGSAEDGFQRLAAARHDYALPPIRPTALDHLVAAGVATHAIGKINDIFGGRGVASHETTANNAAGITATVRALRTRAAPMLFTNLVDFDSSYGHRNDPIGYGRALAEFDAALPDILFALPDDGILMLTADHGNDPTWPGTDHTREAVPLLVAGACVAPVDLGSRATFGDLGATLLDALGVEAEVNGTSFLGEILAAD